MSEHLPQEPGPVETSAGSIDTTTRPSMAAGVRSSERCGCGGHLIERTRKDDGRVFLGCTRFPTCRRTKAVTD
jgi:hypothetical protein